MVRSGPATFLPNEPAKEDRQQLAYWREQGSSLLVDYLKLELEQEIRIVVQNARLGRAPAVLGDLAL